MIIGIVALGLVLGTIAVIIDLRERRLARAERFEPFYQMLAEAEGREVLR